MGVQDRDWYRDAVRKRLGLPEEQRRSPRKWPGVNKRERIQSSFGPRPPVQMPLWIQVALWLVVGGACLMGLFKLLVQS